jgi:hypothetical protein
MMVVRVVHVSAASHSLTVANNVTGMTRERVIGERPT